MTLAAEREILGPVAVIDCPKASCREAIAELRRMLIQTAIITEDNLATAQAIAQQVRIDKVIANVLPQDRETKIREFQRQK